MRIVCGLQAAVGVVVFALCGVPGALAQTMDQVTYFADSIAEKEDLVVRLAGGSRWLMANRTRALPQTEVLVVTRDVMVEGERVRAAWLYVAGQEIPVRHVEGVYPANAAYLTRVVGAADRGTTLRLADGTEWSVPNDDGNGISRWIPPYKALLTDDRAYLYNLKEGTRVWVQPAKSKN